MRFLSIFILMLTGCASNEQLQMAYNAQTEAVKAQAARLQMDTLVIECGTSANSCLGLKIRYTDPRDRAITVPHIRTQNDVLVETMPFAIKAIGILGAAWAATEIVNDVARHSGDTTTINQAIGGESQGHIDMSRSADLSVTGDTAINTSTDTQTDNSNNWSDSYNQTATPTVVTQPPPVVVPAPEPVIIPLAPPQ